MEEQDILDRSKAREIVQTVMNYGVNQAQIKQMIYLLAMELEEVSLLKDITNLIKAESQDANTTSILGGE